MTLRSLVLLLIIPAMAIGNNIAIISDTDPPEITTLPTDLTLPCGVPYQQQFDTWIESHGGLAVSDAGTVEFFNTFQEDLDEAILNSSDTLCGSTAIIPIGFYAIDDCNNVSDTAFANFIIEDTAQPLIITGASALNIQCDEGALDSLQNWLDNIGGAVANEVCEGDFIWNNYIWNDNLGNSGFANVGDTTNIEIIRTNCDWFVDVTFFVIDDCGNANATTSNFTLIDTLPPLILNFLTDTIIACVDSIPNLTPNFLDECDGSLVLSTNIESTQGDDPAACDFYNYSVISSYQASDICGNENSAEQVLEVVDTLAPIIVANQEIIIDCNTDINDIENFIDSIIDCAPVETTFTDSLIFTSSCSDQFLRKWNFVDVCGNATSLRQDVTIIDQDGPSVLGQIPSLELECSQLGIMEENLNAYIVMLFNVQVEDNCGTGTTFLNNAADPEEIIFDFQYTPDLSCEGNSLLQQESVSLSLVDDCGNFEQAVSSIRIVDTIPPAILDCPSSINFELEDGNCEIEIPFSDFTVDMQCDSSESLYFFDREIKLDSFNSETGNINFAWDFAPGDSVLLLEGARIELSTQGILNDDLGIDLNVVDQEGNIIVEYSEPLSFCDDQTLEFSIDNSFAKSWVNAGNINIDMVYRIDDFFECTEEVKIGIKVVIPTLTDNPTKYFYSLDGESERAYSLGDSIILSSGIHEFMYIVEDCAGLRDSCTQTVAIQDLELPELNCPTDLNIVIPDNACEIDFFLNPAFEFIENCTSEFNFQQSLPEADDRFMNFTEQDNGDIIADNIQVNFENVNLDNIIINPVLIVEILANTNDENGVFSIRDENGASLGSTPQNESTCLEPQSIVIELTLDQLMEWNDDGSIGFNFITIDANNGGVMPCSPDDFNGQTDMSSFLSATLAFTEITPSIVVTDLNNDTLDINDGQILFEKGVYNVQLATSDSFGNISSCTYQISVEDTTGPLIDCEDTDIEIGILDQSINPGLGVIDFVILDNCDSLTVDIDITSLNCTDIGSSILANLVATDETGNTSECFFNFNVIGKPLEPTFSSSLCGGDTLSLMNNVVGAGPLTYEWAGPNGYTSSEPNPKIANVGAQESGTYSVEVTTVDGCVFAGFVDVLIEALDIPEIESDNNIVCQGDELTLISNSFSDEVLYIWYEGIAPDGNIIGTTTLPMIVLDPSIGFHDYYCIVDGSGCQSEASNNYQIEVIEHPIALVSENFITVCEGEPFSLSTDNTNPSLDFIWSGPNGYSSNDPNPDEIQNTTADQQGTYQLVVDDRGCLSSPASLEVIIFSTPDKPIIVGENVLCEGSDFSLTVSNITSADKYTWFQNGIFYNTTNTNSLIILSAQQDISGDWTVVVEDDNCTSEISDIFIVNIETQITIGANNNGPICEGGIVTLMASFIPDAQYIWTTPNDQEFFGRVVDVPAVSGVYSVDVITAVGCEGSANTIVEIIQVPEITALSNSSLNCMEVGDEITFSPSIFPPGNYIYQWFGANNFNSDEINPTAIYQGNISNGIYSLQIRNGNCLSDLSITEVNSTLIPPQPTITQDGASCLGDAINILASNVGADVEEYLWDTPIGQITTTEPALTISPSSNINIGDYSLTVVVNGCSSSESESINIALENEITAPQIEGPNALCINQELTLQAINPNINYNYTWIAPDGTNITGATLNIANFNDLDAGNYFLQAEVNSCASEFSSPFLVELITGPQSPILSMSEIRYCEDNLSNINIENIISSPLAGEYILRDDNGDILAISTTGNFNNLDLSGLAIGFHAFTINLGVNDCESEPAQLAIFVDAIPEAASFGFDILGVCDLGFQQIEINNPTGVDVEIEINGDNLFIQSQIQDQIIFNIIDFGVAEVTINSIHPTCGVFSSETAIISIIDEINANDDTFTILGLNSTMVSVLENDIFNNTPIVTINNPANGPTAEVAGEMIIINTNNQEGEFTIPYTICDIDCPEVCDEALINVSITDVPENEGCRPFNVITPNADNQNDFFEIPCTSASDQIEVKIYNSFGALMYSSDDYQGDWSGTRNGQDAPSGTYYYYVKINQDQPMAGFLVVER